MRTAVRLPIDRADPRRHLEQEWLLSSGQGGYAMGTVLGAATRRYHGLLVGATAPPVGRVVALHSLLEQLELLEPGGGRVDLATQLFDDPPRPHPAGFDHLVDFEHDPAAGRVAWRYRVGAVELIKALTLRRDGALDVTYETGRLDRPLRLHVRPLTPLRDFHALGRAEGAAIEFDGGRGGTGGTILVRRGPLGLRLTAGPGASWHAEPESWRGLRYPEDRARGQGWVEDVWSPGRLAIDLPAGSGSLWRGLVELEIDGSTAAPPMAVAARCSQRPLPSREGVGGGSSGGAPSAQDDEPRTLGPASASTRGRLDAAAEQFVVWRRLSKDADHRDGRGWGRSIIAGYPWFADWGRDAMIALPGLLLGRGRTAGARSVLETFGAHVRRGLIPNRFDDHAGPAHYNTVDAALWFVHAVWLLWRRESAAARGLIDTCRSIVEAYRHGTDHGIREDDDGLVRAGDETTQLTWMDARRDGVVFTPRHGKAVEINALWHHGQLALAGMVESRAESAALRDGAARTADSFRRAFWRPGAGACHDVLLPRDGGWWGDGRIRPNQIFAASLPYSPLGPEARAALVETVARHLLTPFGLRTLDPADPEYRGRYEGPLFDRDAAYHQGTVWPWLLGPFGEAHLRVHGFSAAAREHVRRLMEPLLGELERGCLGQLAEVYDGDPPHRASGCPAQAWSVAELLRLLDLVEEPGPGAIPSPG